jgi:hypothetical protein
MGIFSQAINELQLSGLPVSRPQSFMDYLNKNQLGVKNTASSISIDSIKRLDHELRQNNIMVFRLGASEQGAGSQFALAKSSMNNLSDYFILDQDEFESLSPELFIPTVSYRTLSSFNLLPFFTETSIVNLAVFSGLLGNALGLDEGILSAPATGQSTFTFKVFPKADNKIVWGHNNGQVEIDSFFTGQRNGKPVAVIMEAKKSEGLDSLAKHKLLYPFLALNPSLPSYMDIILVYLRAIRQEDGFHFYIAECMPKNGNVSIDSLSIIKKSHFVLKL